MNSQASLKIAVLPGDGIGVDVMQASIPIFDVLQVPVDLIWGDIGWHYWCQEGTPIPERTWRLINQVDAVLLGAITSKPQREATQELAPFLRDNTLNYVSPIIQLRQNLDLYANVRPCFDIKEQSSFKFCVIRENTEGLYCGFDYHPVPEALQELLEKNHRWSRVAKNEMSVSLRLQSKQGLLRLFEFGFAYAQKQGYQRVTFADKPNVLRKSGAFARELFESVAARYPTIMTEILNVDAVTLWMIRRPENFGVIIAENMFGDILSDVGAGVMGGLGFAPSANIGESGCYFEPVHGSAPNMKPNTANPSAMFLSIALLLEHYNYHAASQKIKQAIKSVISQGRFLTYDVGGTATTNEMAAAIIDNC